MDSAEIPYGKGCRPLAGRIILELEPAPDKIGSLYTPETTQTQREQCQFAKVIAVGYGPYAIPEEQPDGKKKLKRYAGVDPSELAIGDRVLYRPLLNEVGLKRIVTDVRRVDGVVESWPQRQLYCSPLLRFGRVLPPC